MNSKKTTYTDQFEALVDNDIIELFDANEKAVSEIAKEIFGDTNELYRSTKRIVESAIEEGGKRRAAISIDNLNKQSTPTRTNVFKWSLNKKLNLIQKISTEKKLTLAARNRTTSSDDEVNEDIEDFIDLGIIDSDGNIL